MKKVKLKRKWIVIGFIALLALVVIIAMTSGQKTKKTMVQTSKITRGNIEKVIEVQGNVQAQDSAEITSPYNFEVTNITVKEGDRVQKGQILASLDQKDLLNEITLLKKEISYDQMRLNENINNANEVYTSTKSLQLAVDNAKLALDTAIENLNKQKELFDAGAVAKIELDNAINSKEQAQIAYNQALEGLNKGKSDINNAVKQSKPKQSDVEAINIKRTTLSQKMAKLNDLQIKSPINGTVTRVYAKLGRNAKDTENNQPMFIIEDDSKKYIVAKVGEYDISDIKLGQEVKIKSDVLGDGFVKGTVSRISPTGEQIQGTKNIVVPVKILITQNDPRLITGVTAKANIKIEQVNNILKTPFENILTKDKKNFVFVVENDKLKKVEVVTGLESDFDVQISSDKIKENMIIVKSPTEELKDGEQVTIMDENTMPVDGKTPEKQDKK